MNFSGRNAPHREGSALVAVIWLIGILALAAVAVLQVVALDIDVATARIHGFRAAQLAEMGIAIGAHPAVKRDDPILSQWSDEGGEGFRVELVSEGSKFNINSILFKEDKNLLKSMFIDWGMELDEAAGLADALGDWVDPDNTAGLNGAEREWYEAAGRMNQPFDRPFYEVEEMRLVRGMDRVEALRPDWREWFTVWSSGGLDVNEAPAEMIAVAAEVDVGTASIIPETVRGPDALLGTQDDTPFQSPEEALALLGVDGSLRPDLSARFTANETTTRIRSLGIAAGARRMISVIVRNKTGQPTVLERKEEVVP